MTDTPVIRAARALAKSDSGEDCYDSLDETMQLRLQESARAVLDSQWQPIETAPTDGQRVLLGKAGTWSGEHRWVDGEWWEINNDPTDAWGGPIYGATHWQSLTPPE